MLSASSGRLWEAFAASNFSSSNNNSSDTISVNVFLPVKFVKGTHVQWCFARISQAQGDTLLSILATAFCLSIHLRRVRNSTALHNSTSNDDGYSCRIRGFGRPGCITRHPSTQCNTMVRWATP